MTFGVTVSILWREETTVGEEYVAFSMLKHQYKSKHLDNNPNLSRPLKHSCWWAVLSHCGWPAKYVHSCIYT